MANLLLVLAVICGLTGQVTPDRSDDCKASSSGGCYWIDYMKSGMTFSKGASTCESYGSVMAVIPDQKTYDEIVENAREILRENNDGKRLTRGFWTATTYNPSSNTMTPDGAFNGNWYKNFPSSRSDWTRILVTVRLDNLPYQGLRNEKPSVTRAHKGVVCWKTRSAITSTSTGDCQVTYDGKCFSIKTYAFKISLNAGRQLCQSKGGKVGNIYAKSQYDQITALMRNIAGNGDLSIWIGLKYNGSTVTLSDGSPAPYVKWAPGYPASQDPDMAIVVKSDQAYPYQYMQNYGRSFMRGVLCEK